MGTALGSRSASAVIGVEQSLPSDVVVDISGALTNILADIFALYVKTKNFHWHMSGPHFRDYHLLLDEQADQVFAMVDAVAERCRKIGGQTIRSVGEVARRQRLKDSDVQELSPGAMLSELRADNLRLREFMLHAHTLCERLEDVASASALENWIDEAEKRIWFLFECSRN
ncbi:Dps family protein [Bradyrhizobium canariense]|uniref:Dps family protein n=1 Tax=Bradyrhizobium canariense TaxID=255045 RepID=UPI000A19A113|nr:DNA starvation/stationary phase protection protein [Bradyrhizobium canariense]OSI20485.1 DNA starvation/stationary phase protection protein [Bradyrhizobium canariense]OSI33404.1 DNA starvation/stationary phase protection protein [Bradyrhizobium canariense]OSI39623.1 DNA starvation/stationary phase protection protein [Bradyrhizobium canariense]OSI47647.1 DNA starvation/stationary phase protection protein [Bradyrhizobium canariense]OSI55990.1 DNA starvation/stationary phase protection protein